MKLEGVRNYKTGSGRPPGLDAHVKTVLQFDAGRRRQQARSAAMLKAWGHTWDLPNHDPNTVRWVGVNPYSYEQLGKLDTVALEQSPVDLSSLSGALHIDFHHSVVLRQGSGLISFSALIANEVEDAGLPLPMVSRGVEEFGKSDIAEYPINQQGILGRTFPTKRVHTLGQLLMEKDVWPEQYQWVLQYVPVYQTTAFIPFPQTGASDAASFIPDYCFRLSGPQPLIVHRIIEDRYSGSVYNGPSGSILAPTKYGINLTDVKLSGEEAKHCLFRAVDSPSLAVNVPNGPSVSGRFIFVVLQQPEEKISFINGPGMDPGSVFRFADKGTEIFRTGVSAGRELQPVTYGDGAKLDPRRLPMIFDVRVLGVRETDDIDADWVDRASNVVPFNRSD